MREEKKDKKIQIKIEFPASNKLQFDLLINTTE